MYLRATLTRLYSGEPAPLAARLTDFPKSPTRLPAAAIRSVLGGNIPGQIRPAFSFMSRCDRIYLGVVSWAAQGVHIYTADPCRNYGMYGVDGCASSWRRAAYCVGGFPRYCGHRQNPAPINAFEMKRGAVRRRPVVYTNLFGFGRAPGALWRGGGRAAHHVSPRRRALGRPSAIPRSSSADALRIWGFGVSWA